MDSSLVAAIALLLLVIVLPVGLGTAEYLRRSRMEKPIASFRYVIWRDFDLLMTLFQTTYGLALLVGVGVVANHFGPQLISLIIAIPLLFWAWRQFPGIRLYWTYWQYDGRACFEVQRVQKSAHYTNQQVEVTFALSEVRRLVLHTPPLNSRAASSDYSYTCLWLTDHRTLYITSLLCDFVDLRTLLPTISAEVVYESFAWLPNDHLSQKIFGPYRK